MWWWFKKTMRGSEIPVLLEEKELSRLRVRVQAVNHLRRGCSMVQIVHLADRQRREDWDREMLIDDDHRALLWDLNRFAVRNELFDAANLGSLGTCGGNEFYLFSITRKVRTRKGGMTK